MKKTLIIIGGFVMAITAGASIWLATNDTAKAAVKDKVESITVRFHK